METEEENGEGEDCVEETGTEVDGVVAVTADGSSVAGSLPPRDLMEHCRSCLRLRIRSCSLPHRPESAGLLSPPDRTLPFGSFSWEVVDVEVDEVEHAGDGTVDGGETERRRDTSVEEAEERAGEDSDVEDDIASPWPTSVSRFLLAARIRS